MAAATDKNLHPLRERIRIIGAGAGSGKTYRITEIIADALQKKQVRPEGIIATTFTIKAANELKGRVRRKLHAAGMTGEALRIEHSCVGTVHSVCHQLLNRFALDLGISPALEVLDAIEEKLLFNRAVTELLDEDLDRALRETGRRFMNAHYDEPTDWRDDLNRLVQTARANNVSPEDLEESLQSSWATFAAFLPKAGDSSDFDNRELLRVLRTAEAQLKANIESGDDSTKVSAGYLDKIRSMIQPLRSGRDLTWSQWVTLAGDGPSKRKSAGIAEPVQALAGRFAEHPQLHEDLERRIGAVFSLTRAALTSYQDYKRKRGFVDFTDLETLTLRLLDLPTVTERLSEEIDLLIVDEFQDTSPIQLELFLKLARCATLTVFVGDPKQAIYAFRGTDPALMEAVVQEVGEPKKEDILNVSYRSRPPLVQFVSELFSNAYSGRYPRERVALAPHRTDKSESPSVIRLMCSAPDGKDNADLRAASIASGVQQLIGSARKIVDTDSGELRTIRGGDIAILCRSNRECERTAWFLKEAGIESTRSQPGLLVTHEGRLLVAAMQRTVNSGDALAAAEIMLLTSDRPDTESMLSDRLDWITKNNPSWQWGASHPFVEKIDAFARGVVLSPRELLEQLTNLLDLRRRCVAWGPRPGRQTSSK